LGLPLAAYAIARFCGKSHSGAIIVTIVTPIFLLCLTVVPVIGFVFVPIFGVYARDAERVLHDPDSQLFLTLGVPLALAVVALLSHEFH